jgi:hypothetical protein
MANEGMPEARQALTNRVEAIKEKLSSQYNSTEALDESLKTLGETLAGLQNGLGEAVGKLKDAGEQQKVRAAFGRELVEAIMALRNNLPVSSNADKVVDAANRELVALGVILDKGPATYPAPKLFGLVGEPQVTQWLKDADIDPEVAIKIIADDIGGERIKIADEAARREGVMIATVSPNISNALGKTKSNIARANDASNQTGEFKDQ